MKQITIITCLVTACLFVGCGTKDNKQTPPVASEDKAVIAPTNPGPTPIQLPVHTDNGETFFSYIIKKGDSLVNQVQSEKPVAFQGSKNIIIQLDSSHHLLVNATGLNIYLNAKVSGDYPIASNTGKNESSILGGWLEKDETRTSYSVQKGLVTISKMENGQCSGIFEGSFTLNGGDYELKGEFFHVKIN